MRLRCDNVGFWYWFPRLHHIGHGGLVATLRWGFWYVRVIGGKQ